MSKIRLLLALTLVCSLVPVADATVQYHLKNSGTCDSPITTLQECGTAAAALGFVASGYAASQGQNEVYNTIIPPGCMWTSNPRPPAFQTLMFNNPATHAGTCGGTPGSDQCICKGAAPSSPYFVKTWGICDSPITTLLSARMLRPACRVPTPTCNTKTISLQGEFLRAASG